ncbi:MAG: ArsR/SmtB family transcription factor [Desulfohalobiaceae bacterium]
MTSFELRAKVFKALGHPGRLAMVEAVLQEEKCVCELQELVGSDMSTVSKHLSILRDAGILKMRKEGTSVYYSLKLSCVRSFLSCLGTSLETMFNQYLDQISSDALPETGHVSVSHARTS